MQHDHVAIVGGGFSGALLAINLLRHDGPHATLIERRAETARGIAYSTIHPEHVLNVRAANMSALPDDPGHFLRWLERRAIGPHNGFVPRRAYGAYLDELLDEAVARGGSRLRVIRSDARDVELGAEGADVLLDDGTRIRCDRIALALGNLPPTAPPGLDLERLPKGVHVADPWSHSLTDGLQGGDTVLVIGTGLTMIDIALLLDAERFDGRIIALSRRGLIPLTHADALPGTIRAERPSPGCLALLADIRSRSKAVDWRSAVDELRPFTQSIWRAMPVAERRRFLRHLRPWWDVHRHRIAPHVAERIAIMRREGRLEVIAGRPIGVAPLGDRSARVQLRRRGEDRIETVDVARIVNGTGPQGDLTRTREPLLINLVRRRLIRPDPLHIGIDVDQNSRAIAGDGSASDRLLVLGPMTRGNFWEIVAVPDIRQQVWSVARYLSAAHWVEGEGL